MKNIKQLFPGALKDWIKDQIIRWDSLAFTRPLNELCTFELDKGTGAWPTLLIGSIHGLLLFDGQQLRKLFGGSIYGVSTHEGRWYAFQKVEHKYGSIGRLVSFSIDQQEVKAIQIELDGLDPDVHQIDFTNNILYITDTANNALRRYRFVQGSLQEMPAVYPAGLLDQGLNSSNYVHMNSVFSLDDRRYLIYHNHTNKTGKNSQIAILNSADKIVDLKETKFGCSHNYVPCGEGAIVCDSQNHAAYLGNSKILQCTEFTRGVSVTSEDIYIGGSQIVDRVKRGDPSLTGKIYRIDRDSLKVVDVLQLPSIGNIYELRVVDEKDFGLSNTR